MNYNIRDLRRIKSIAGGGATKDALEQSPRRVRRGAISYQSVTVLAILLDALIIFATGILSGVVYHLATVGYPGDIERFSGFAAVVAGLFIGLAKHRELYGLPELLNLKSQIMRITTKWVSVFLLITAAGFAMKVNADFSRGMTISFAIFGLISLICARAYWRIFIASGLAKHRFSGRKACLIVENSASADEDLLTTLTRHGLEVVKHFVLPASADLQHRKDIIAKAVKSLRGSDVEEIVVGANIAHWSQLSHLLAEFRVLPLPLNFIPVGPSSELFKLSSHTIGDTITIEMQRSPRTRLELITKRLVDILVAGTSLVLMLPLLIVTAMAVKLDSPGPVLFRQKRCGFNGRPFYIMKFRSMSVMEDGSTIVAAKPNDARVTQLGSWLRRTSIDELPQLWNVLQGSMSIVGPRPHAMAHDQEFDKVVSNYAFRQHVKPGLTGWAQVNGFRGELRTIEDIEQRVKFDLWYIDNWSFALDFRIMLMTAIQLLRGGNAY